jgi:hypothetical protein
VGCWKVVEEVVCLGGEVFDSVHKRGYVELKSGIKRSGGEKDTRKDEIGRRKNKNRREKDVRNYKSNGIFFKKKAVVKS